MCFYNGINVNRATHIRLKKIEKEIGGFRPEVQRPVQSGFAYGLGLFNRCTGLNTPVFPFSVAVRNLYESGGLATSSH
jgi:hypothetical protein